MECLILVAHGSRKEAANHEVRDLATRVAAQDGNNFEEVVPAFLEFAQPDIGRGVDYCASLGAKTITVLPYFLSAGNHVARDVPSQLETARLRHPTINIQVVPHFGASQSIVGAIIECTSETVT